MNLCVMDTSNISQINNKNESHTEVRCPFFMFVIL